VWSEGLEREAVYVSAAVGSFELAKSILKRIGQIEVSQPSIWRCTQAAGERFQTLEAYERARAGALPEAWQPVSRSAVADQRMGVALDGVMLHVREEGWKETKVGCVFEVALAPSQDPVTHETVETAHAVHNSYVAHLGGPEVTGELTWAEARRRGWEQAQDTVVLGDGAPWIWNQAALHFGTSLQVVDWYHAKQHLTTAAALLKAEGTPAFVRWLNSRETLLYQGQAARIADELDQAVSQGAPHAETLAREAAFFRHNQLRMNYLEMREEGWPIACGGRCAIGSGMVESAAKQFKTRFCGPGMRWSRKGAENLLPIRAALLSGRFDQMWAAAKNPPPV
jgi:hypothetical protein